MIPILQPHIPHYRSDFFKGLKKSLNTKLFCYEDINGGKNSNFSESDMETSQIWNLAFGPFLLYSPLPFLKNNKKMVLMLNIAHFTTWLLLFTKFIHKREVVLWGHGISVKRYLKEEKEPSPLMKLMIKLADVIWFYTEQEKKLWENHFPDKKIVALNNTISSVDDILAYTPKETLSELKIKHKIKHDKCFIFCARFDNPYRRIDLLEKIIATVDKDYGFIIIGNGKFKPDFSKYSNVYDFGSVYDAKVKNELFTIADIYLQPGWVGLSIVEAMAYGLPVFTFLRSEDTLQCVEYAYLKNNYNSMLFSDMNDFKVKVNCMTENEIELLGSNAKHYVKDNLLMDTMVHRAVESVH